jgi:predicted AlkP superfamily phosphohydrolase/phosphomutase
VNYATLMTGVSPVTHGIADGTMRSPGYPLSAVLPGGYSSFAKLVPPIWVQLEKAGYLVSLQSLPGSTPPEISRGNTIRGRWGAWGIDMPALVFQDKLSKQPFSGPDFTRFTEPVRITDWKIGGEALDTHQPSYDVRFSNWGFDLYGHVYRSKDAKGDVFDRVLFSHDRKTALANLAVGEWSGWLPVTLNYGLKGSTTSAEIDTFIKLKVIRLGKSGEFRVRILYDGLNELSTSPPRLADEMRTQVGHMTDFVDNYPPQLVYFPEDQRTFVEEAGLSWDWHRKAVPYLTRKLESDVVIHSIYSPNQQLTSRWWLPFIDKDSRRYGEKTEPERALLWSEIKAMYKQADDVLGEIMKSTDSSWYVVLSSDHGVIPLYREVRLNNLFAKKGWLKYRIDPKTRESEIDWKKTKVVYLQMNSIYINPTGLAGPYKRATSKAYLKLRAEVVHLLEDLKDTESGSKVASRVWTHEDAAQAGLPENRVGDLIIANAPQFLWSEDLSADQAVFTGSLKGGYKQGIWPNDVEGMLTPFVIMGPGIKHGCQLADPIRHVDQFATIAHLMGIQAPYKVEGTVLNDVLQKSR